MPIINVPSSQSATERSPYQLAVEFTNENSSGITSTDFDSLTLKLFDLESGDYINTTSSGIDIHNTGRGSFSTGSTTLTLTLENDDQQIVNTALEREIHVAFIEGVYPSGGSKNHRTEIRYPIVNLTKTT